MFNNRVSRKPGAIQFGEGEWKVRKHGKEKRRGWRKLHLAMDPASHDIVAAEVLLETVHDAEVLPTLLNPLRRKLGTVYADGAYDTRAREPHLCNAEGGHKNDFFMQSFWITAISQSPVNIWVCGVTVWADSENLPLEIRAPQLLWGFRSLHFHTTGNKS